MSLRIRQPLLIPPATNPVGTVNATLSDATVVSSATTGTIITGSVAQSLNDCVLVANNFTAAQIYQEIWIIDGRKPKKRIKKTQRKIRHATETIQRTIKQAVRDIELNAPLKTTVVETTDALNKQLFLLESKYNILKEEAKLRAAESRLASLIEEAKERAIKDLQQKILELVAAGRARKAKEELDELNLVLDFLMVMDLYDD